MYRKSHFARDEIASLNYRIHKPQLLPHIFYWRKNNLNFLPKYRYKRITGQVSTEGVTFIHLAWSGKTVFHIAWERMSTHFESRAAMSRVFKKSWFFISVLGLRLLLVGPLSPKQGSFLFFYTGKYTCESLIV